MYRHQITANSYLSCLWTLTRQLLNVALRQNGLLDLKHGIGDSNFDSISARTYDLDARAGPAILAASCAQVICARWKFSDISCRIYLADRDRLEICEIIFYRNEHIKRFKLNPRDIST